ncbi:CHAT domain-containing protein [Streptomyces aureocirculatus]|uniref:CHAT domain-containing protein n=1 Tax=Streptomyces aureocirculatus TaxID=67275 RepID=UPI00068CCE87|nr:CHAT domain-containing protein [Streptomyces aureocirculatus]
MTGQRRTTRRSRVGRLWRTALSLARASVDGAPEAQAGLLAAVSLLRRSPAVLRRGTAARDLAALTSHLDALGLHATVQVLLDELAAGVLSGTLEVSDDAASRNQLAVTFAGRGRLTAAAHLLARPSSPPGSAEDTALRARALANTAAVALRLGDFAEATRHAREALDALPADTAPGSRIDVRLLALAVRTAAVRAVGEDATADALLPDLDAAVREVVRQRGSDHPSSLSALVTLASAESASAGAAGDRERQERATDVLAIAAQKASALMGPEHPQAVSATLAHATAEYETAAGSGSPQRLGNAEALMVAAAERAGALLRETGGAVPRPGPAGGRSGAREATTPARHGSTAAPHGASEPTEAELALTRDQVREAVGLLPSHAPRTPVLLGLLGELSLADHIHGEGAPNDLREAATAFDEAFRAPADSTSWHRWRILHGYAQVLRYETRGRAEITPAIDALRLGHALDVQSALRLRNAHDFRDALDALGSLDEAVKLLTTGLAKLPPGRDDLRTLAVLLLAHCSLRRYETCRAHPGRYPALRLPALLDETVARHVTATAVVPPRTPEATALVETLARLHLERLLLGAATGSSTDPATDPAYSDSVSSETTWESLAARTYGQALVWRETRDEDRAAAVEATLRTVLAAPDALDRLPRGALRAFAWLLHHRGSERSDTTALSLALTLLRHAGRASAEARADAVSRSWLDGLSRLAPGPPPPDHLSTDRRRQLSQRVTWGPGPEPPAPEEFPDWFALAADSVELTAFETDRAADSSWQVPGHARLAAAHEAVLEARWCMRRGDLATTDHYLAEAAGIHATFDSDHPARLETWMLLSRTHLLRDSLARHRGDSPGAHPVPPPTPAQIRHEAARLSGDRRTRLLGEAGVSLLLSGGETRRSEATSLLREAYEVLDADHQGFLRYSYYLGAAECFHVAPGSGRHTREAQLASGIQVLERAATVAEGTDRHGWGNIAFALARAYRARDAALREDRSSSLRTGLRAARAMAAAAPAAGAGPGREAGDHLTAGHPASAAREVATWCYEDGALDTLVHALELWRATSLPGAPPGTPPQLAEIGRALTASGRDALVYLVPASDSAAGLALVVTDSARTYAIPLPDLIDDTGPVPAYLRDPSSLPDLCAWAARAAMSPLLTTLADARAGGLPRLVLVPLGRLGAVPWHAACRHDTRDGGERRQYALEHAEFTYAVSARALCDEVRGGRVPRRRVPLDAAPAVAYGPQDALRRLRAVPPADGGVLTLAGPAHYRDGRGGPELTLPGGPLRLASVAEALRRRRLGEPATVLVTDCQGDGLVRDDEAALRLSAALQWAGACTVVAPLWPVRDSATSALLSLTHHFLRTGGTTPATALRTAQMWMLDSHRRLPSDLRPGVADAVRHLPPGRPVDPVDWAAYVCFGT